MERITIIFLTIIVSATVTVAVVTTIKKDSIVAEKPTSEVFVPVEKRVEPEYQEPKYPMIPQSHSPKSVFEVKVIESVKEMIPPVNVPEVVIPKYVPESIPIVIPPAESTPTIPIEPIVLEARFTLTLPADSPIVQPKERMTLKELQFFTANLFKVTDSPYSKLLKASEEELTQFLQSNGYTILREML